MASDISFSLSVPGKIILIGEHSVLYKKKGIAVSIGKRTNLSFKEKREVHDQISINLINLNSLTVWDFKSVYDFINRQKPLICSNEEFSICTPDKINHEKYLSVITEFIDSKVDKLDKNAKSAITGLFYIIGAMLWCSNVDLYPFDIEIKSDLVMGAGTGSSAAFSVCVSAAFYHYLKLKAALEHTSEKMNICNGKFKQYFVENPSHETQMKIEDLTVVNKWAFCVEKIMHSKPSGIDNTVCTYGSAIVINANEKSTDSPLEPFEDLPKLNILLINTGVERNTKDLVKKVSDLRELIPEAIDAVLSSMDRVAATFIQILTQLKQADDIEAKNLYRKLEGLIDVSQGLLVTLGVSHIRLDEACMITRRRGVHTKLTGAGGGGYAFSLLPPDLPQSEIKATILDLESCGFHVQQLSVGGPGLSLHAQ